MQGGPHHSANGRGPRRGHLRLVHSADRPAADAVPRRPAPAPNGLVLFARAFLLRCPVCGSGGVFDSWFKIKPRCPTCGFSLEREEGYFSGAMAVNLVATELILTTVLVTLLIVSWPLAATWPMAPQIQFAWYGAMAAAVILPLLSYPFSRTLWVAFDLLFRPPTPADFRETIPRVR